MPHSARPLILALGLMLGFLCPVLAQTPDLPFNAAEIEAAQYDGSDLPRGRSALTAKVQLLLDRSGTSPGVIDGYKGGMSRSALMAFERRTGLPQDGVMDPHIWNLLQSFATRPVTQSYTITADDAAGLVASIPRDYAEKAAMPAMAHTSIAERLSERFHMDEKFIAFLNPGVAIIPGATINVMAPNRPLSGQVTRILIDSDSRRVAGYNARGQMIVDYPATIGSSVTPSPKGTHAVRNVAVNPNYTYNPDVNFRQAGNDRPLIVPPGPNGPVGTVWIGLSKPTYGIHGTPSPSQLFSNQSMGCVRLTNWDAEELARMVRTGETVVEFLEPGVSIADATGSGTAISPPIADIALPADSQPQTDMPTTAQPLVLPNPFAAQDSANTSTPQGTQPAAEPPADLLNDALTDALPDGFIAPQPGTAQP